MGHDVFISFSSKDTDMAHRVYDGLVTRGVKCWISSKDIPAGGNYQNAIVNALTSARVMVLVFSANANSSEEIPKELALAAQNRLAVMPLKIDDVKPTGGFIYNLATSQWVEIFPDFEKNLDNVATTIKAITEKSDKFALEVREAIKDDGVVGPTEQKILEGMGVDMGLTIEQARIIIKDMVGGSTRSNIQECELQYLQIITKYMEDGIISSIEKMQLAREAKSLGISDSRAHALLEQEKAKLDISDVSTPAVMPSHTSQGHSTNNDRQIGSGQNIISPYTQTDNGMQAQSNEAVANQCEPVHAPLHADQTEYDELCIEIRQVFNDGAVRERNIAIVELARALNYQRTGKNIRETLSNALNAAVQRGILQNECDQLSLLCRSIEQFDRNFLKDQFIASLGGQVWAERDDAIKAFGRWMGFRRTGPVIDDTARSLINGLLREQRLESDGSQIRRVE